MSSRLARMALEGLSAHAARPGSACGARDEIVVVFLVAFLDAFSLHCMGSEAPGGCDHAEGSKCIGGCIT